MRRLALPILPILAITLGAVGIWIGGRNAVAPLAFSGMAAFYSGLVALAERFRFSGPSGEHAAF